MTLYFRFVEKRIVKRVFSNYLELRRRSPGADDRSVLKQTATFTLQDLSDQHIPQKLEDWFGDPSDIRDVKDLASVILATTLPLGEDEPKKREREFARRLAFIENLYAEEFLGV